MALDYGIHPKLYGYGTSGDINWLLDVIAPDQKTTANVIANFKQVVTDGDLRLHPIVTRLVNAETLEKMGAKQNG